MHDLCSYFYLQSHRPIRIAPAFFSWGYRRTQELGFGSTSCSKLRKTWRDLNIRSSFAQIRFLGEWVSTEFLMEIRVRARSRDMKYCTEIPWQYWPISCKLLHGSTALFPLPMEGVLSSDGVELTIAHFLCIGKGILITEEQVLENGELGDTWWSCPTGVALHFLIPRTTVWKRII